MSRKIEQSGLFSGGAPGVTRTPDLLVRRQSDEAQTIDNTAEYDPIPSPDAGSSALIEQDSEQAKARAVGCPAGVSDQMRRREAARDKQEDP